ncbi:MAG: hypothetical protein ACYTAQ_06670 [Planctomycetota bacterium]
MRLRTVGDHRVQQLLSHVAWLQRAEAQPLEAVNRGHGIQEVGQGFVPGPGLPAAQGRLAAVGTDEDPGQHDLPVTQINEVSGLADGVPDLLGPQGSADGRDNAIRATGVTPVLDLQLGPDVAPSRDPGGRREAACNNG